jgi:hypothetical protein
VCADLARGEIFPTAAKKQPSPQSKIPEIRAKLWKKQKGGLEAAFYS